MNDIMQRQQDEIQALKAIEPVSKKFDKITRLQEDLRDSVTIGIKASIPRRLEREYKEEIIRFTDEFLKKKLF